MQNQVGPYTVLQDGEFTALKERVNFKILSNLKPKNRHFSPIEK